MTFFDVPKAPVYCVTEDGVVYATVRTRGATSPGHVLVTILDGERRLDREVPSSSLVDDRLAAVRLGVERTEARLAQVEADPGTDPAYLQLLGDRAASYRLFRHALERGSDV